MKHIILKHHDRIKCIKQIYTKDNNTLVGLWGKHLIKEVDGKFYVTGSSRNRYVNIELTEERLNEHFGLTLKKERND